MNPQLIADKTAAQRAEFDQLKQQSSELEHKIGQGMRLRIPFDNHRPALVEGLSRYGMARNSIPVDRALADFMIRYRPLKKIPEQSAPEITMRVAPLGKTVGVTSTYVGWREAGYDGDKADWYCLVY